MDPASPPGAPPAVPAPGTFGVRILAVSEVTRAVRGAVRQDPRLVDLWVEGEIGRVTVSTAGHAYFALKDERNQLQCVWFRDDRMRSAFEAQAGLRVVVHGRIDLYEPTGALQLYVDSMQPAGFGDLALRFEALKARLTAEGLFDAARKRPLPTRPTTIAVVTSPTGAVWRDVCTVLARRWPLVRVVLRGRPCAGRRGAGEHRHRARPRRALGRSSVTPRDGPSDAPALTIVARGGGSMEDLWAFNDERVVRAVVAHPIPVVAGHRPRGGRHPDRLRGRRPGGHAVRGRRAGRARPGRAGRRAARGRTTAGRRHRTACRDAVARGRRGAACAGPAASGRAAARPRERSGLSWIARPGRSAARLAADQRTVERLAARGRPDAAGPAGPGPSPPGRAAAAARRWPSDGSSGSAPRWRRPARRWRSSGRRPPSTAATRSSGVAPTAPSSATRPMRPAGRRCALGRRRRHAAGHRRRPLSRPAMAGAGRVPRPSSPSSLVVGIGVGILVARWLDRRVAEDDPEAEEPVATNEPMPDPAPATPATPAVETLAFDDALAELQRVVGELEAGGQPLEAALALYERGVALQARCERLIGDAELRVQQLVARARRRPRDPRGAGRSGGTPARARNCDRGQVHRTVTN